MIQKYRYTSLHYLIKRFTIISFLYKGVIIDNNSLKIKHDIRVKAASSFCVKYGGERHHKVHTEEELHGLLGHLLRLPLSIVILSLNIQESLTSSMSVMNLSTVSCHTSVTSPPQATHGTPLSLGHRGSCSPDRHCKSSQG